MGYIEKHLIKNEQVIYKSKISWTVYIKPLIFLLVGIYIKTQSPFGILFIIGSILWLISSFIQSKFSELAVTNKRVLIKTGVIKTNSLETMLHKVEGIFVEQGIIGKILIVVLL